MWRTRRGTRTLEGKEAELFSSALSFLLERLRMEHDFVEAQYQEDDYDAGVAAFDRMTYGQKIAVLTAVGEGLLRHEVALVPLTAAMEAGIGAIFRELHNRVEIEVDDQIHEPPRKRGRRKKPPLDEHPIPVDFGTYWRRGILAVYQQYHPDEAAPIAAKCPDMEEWDFLIEEITDLILWDRDYNDEDVYADLPPEKAKEVRAYMNIPDDYFRAIPLDLTEAQAARAIKRLQWLATEFCNQQQDGGR